jgi:hypothetical protein
MIILPWTESIACSATVSHYCLPLIHQRRDCSSPHRSTRSNELPSHTLNSGPLSSEGLLIDNACALSLSGMYVTDGWTIRSNTKNGKPNDRNLRQVHQISSVFAISKHRTSTWASLKLRPVSRHYCLYRMHDVGPMPSKSVMPCRATTVIH